VLAERTADTDVANLTPLTHLLAARLFGADPNATFDRWDPSSAAKIGRESVAGAQAAVLAELGGKLGLIVPDVPWIGNAFSATQGDAMDGALEELQLRLVEASRTFEQAISELATAGTLVAPPYPLQPACRQGVLAGVPGALGDAQLTVRSGSRTDPGTFEGGAGGGIGGGGGEGNGVGIGGSLGQFRNVDVTVELPDGRRFGPVRTDVAQGAVTFVHCGYAGPVLVTFEGASGSGATYFDESRNAEASFEGQLLRAAVPAVAGGIGVTPFTEAAFRYLGSSLPGDATSSGGLALRAVVQPWHDAARVGIANERVRAVVNDQLPGIYRVDRITRVATPVNAGNASVPGALPDSRNGAYAAVLAGLAKASGAASLPAPALALSNQFAQDLSDGVLDLRVRGIPVATGTATTTYGYETLSELLPVRTGATARRLRGCAPSHQCDGAQPRRRRARRQRLGDPAGRGYGRGHLAAVGV